MAKPMFVFHSDTVNSDSVGSADDGASLDMAAFAVENLVAITAGNTSVELTFKDSAMFGAIATADSDNGALGQVAVLENSLVILTVTDATAAVKVVKLIVEGINSTSPVYNSGMFLFDATADVYACGVAAGDVSAINIRRTTTSRVVSAA